jgi:hypothetical protein
MAICRGQFGGTVGDFDHRSGYDITPRRDAGIEQCLDIGNRSSSDSIASIAGDVRHADMALVPPLWRTVMRPRLDRMAARAP